ncbi:MAG: hypothetical protein ACE5H4_16090 [Candidatus Thorarchaeota archaeon]
MSKNSDSDDDSTDQPTVTTRQVTKETLLCRFLVAVLLLYFIWLLDFAWGAWTIGNRLGDMTWSYTPPGSLIPIPRFAGFLTSRSYVYPVDALFYLVFVNDGVWIIWVVLALSYVVWPLRFDIRKRVREVWRTRRGDATQREETIENTGSIVWKSLSVWLININVFTALVGLVSVFYHVFRYFVLGIPHCEYLGHSWIWILEFPGTDPLSLILRLEPVPFLSVGVFSLYAQVSLFADLLTVLVALIVSAIFGGAATKYAIDHLTSRNSQMRTALRFAFRRAPTLFVVALIQWLVGFVVTTPLLVGLIATMRNGPQHQTIGVYLIPFALIALAYVTARLVPSMAVAVEEGRSAVSSIKRAFQLTGGHTFSVLGSLVLLGILPFVASSFAGAFALSSLRDIGWLASLVPLLLVVVFPLSSIPYAYLSVMYIRLVPARSETSSIN